MDRKVYLALLLFTATVLVVWAFGLILTPFLLPIAWAVCLATVTSGPYRRLLKWTGRPKLSALVVTTVTGALVVVPAVFLVNAIAREAIEISHRVQDDLPAGGGTWSGFLERHEHLAELKRSADTWLATFGTDLNQVTQTAFGKLASPSGAGALGVLSGVLSATFGFLVALATLYVLLRDGRRIGAFVTDLSPLSHEETGRVLETIRATAFSAIVGGFATAIVQGTLGGIALAITGVPAPVLWGFVMAILALLPVGGGAFVWAPVAAYFFLDGPVWKGWFMLAWGVIVLGVTSVTLQPWLMRRTGASEVHPLLLFFAIISGLGLFGPSGIVFGPLVVAAVLVMLDIFREHFGQKARAGRAHAAKQER